MNRFTIDDTEEAEKRIRLQAHQAVRRRYTLYTKPRIDCAKCGEHGGGSWVDVLDINTGDYRFLCRSCYYKVHGRNFKNKRYDK